MPNLNMPGEDVGGRPPVQPMMPGRDTSGIIRIVIIVVVVVLLGGGGFWLYKSGKIPFFGKKATPPAEVVVPPPSQTPETPPAAPPTPAPPAKPTPAVKSKPTPSRPLTKEMMGKGDFTVIIASFQSRRAAEEEAARWLNAGFQSMVTEKRIDGNTWYRVSLGRYETRQMATKAAKEMEHMFESGYWVDRVR